MPAEGVDALLDGLLDRVKEDEEARQEFVDLLETLGPDDPRTTQYRKALAARLVLTRAVAVGGRRHRARPGRQDVRPLGRGR